MDPLINNYHASKQTLTDDIQQLKNWKSKTSYDTLTRKQKNGKIATKHCELQKVITASRFRIVDNMKKLINSSNLDDETKVSLCLSATYLSMFEYGPTTVPFRKIGEGAMKVFEDPATYESRRSYQKLKDKTTQAAYKHAGTYRSGIADIALSLCVENLNQSDRSSTIIDYFQTKSEDGAAEAKKRTDTYVGSYKDTNKQVAEKKKAQKLKHGEKGRRLLNLMVLIEHDGKGNRKLVDCNVTGDQLTLAEINLGSKKRKMK